VGCEARKRPAVADVFFLDFSFYRTYQELAYFPPTMAWKHAENYGDNVKRQRGKDLTF
jgi:hypothetical protein